MLTGDFSPFTHPLLSKVANNGVWHCDIIYIHSQEREANWRSIVYILLPIAYKSIG